VDLHGGVVRRHTAQSTVESKVRCKIINNVQSQAMITPKQK
jgi:hypothetical protein